MLVYLYETLRVCDSIVRHFHERYGLNVWFDLSDFETDGLFCMAGLIYTHTMQTTI